MEPITLHEIEHWLRETSEKALETLWARADQVRKATVGDEVHLRGLIEISNHCVRRCAYCGLAAGNRTIERYRMTREEILECAMKAVRLGYGTVVMQAGEDYGITADWLAEVIREIKTQTPLAVTLSLGERPYDELKLWKQAGADRYLLRFETSDSHLYELIHPSLPGKKSDRFEILRQLQELGYEAGSGVMIGIPGQTYAILARDIQIFSTMDLDMIGVGPFIPSPNTPLGRGEIHFDIDPAQQVPNTELMTYKVVALTRLVRPDANIPSTTALATINKESGRELGLMRGANVVMPNLTPVQYREKYEIYPGKACINETAEQCNGCLRSRIASIGRTVGTGPGGRHIRPK
ncbi:[FeFe] hydrogenase H-cluster radical SAM maturase HydE [Anaerohalosphaeraceae bacterium U12dextr]